MLTSMANINQYIYTLLGLGIAKIVSGKAQEFAKQKWTKESKYSLTFGANITLNKWGAMCFPF